MKYVGMIQKLVNMLCWNIKSKQKGKFPYNWVSNPHSYPIDSIPSAYEPIVCVPHNPKFVLVVWIVWLRSNFFSESRNQLLREGHKRFNKDGINSIKSKTTVTLKDTYTHITVEN